MLNKTQFLASIQPDLEKLTHKLRTYAIKIIDDEKMVCTGLLRTSIQAKLIIDDENPRIELFVNDPGNSKLKYAKYLHEGIKPHMPPLAPIKKWVAVKGIHKSSFRSAWEKTKQGNKGVSRKNQIKKDDLEDRLITNIAWAIAINMKKKGKKPVPFLKLAIQMALKNEQ